MWLPQIHNYLISLPPNQKDKYKNHPQNQRIYKIKHSNWIRAQPTEKIKSILSQKSSSSFTFIFCSYNLLF